MDISRAIDRIRERNKKPRIRKTLKMSWGEPPEFNKWGEKPDGGKKQNKWKII